jgi:hypothetical protein
MPLTEEQRRKIRSIFTAYLQARAKNLKTLALSDMKFNVVQLRATGTMLDLKTPEDLLRYRLAQYLERGAVTAMGGALQKIARELSGSGSGVAGADIEVSRDGRRYFVQVKSGPDTANKDIAQNIATLLNSARARDPAAVCVLGVCYARPEQISTIAKRELEARGVGLKVGREFWEFVSGEPACLEEILEVAGEVGDAIEATLSAQVEAKVHELVADFASMYGAQLDDVTWKRFLANNS